MTGWDTDPGRGLEYSRVPGDDAARPRDRAVRVTLERGMTVRVLVTRCLKSVARVDNPLWTNLCD